MFEAFILAGGRSARMQREKALVKLHGETLVHIADRNLKESGASRITLLSGDKSRILRPYFDGMSLLDDISPGLGAAGGIFTAISNSDAENVFVLACDLPLVTPELIQFLKKRLEGGDADAVVPLQPDTFKQPLCAFYRKSNCIVPFQAQILRSELSPSARDLLARVNTDYVDYEEFAPLKGSGDFFMNINTPLDLESAREIARAK